MTELLAKYIGCNKLLVGLVCSSVKHNEVLQEHFDYILDLFKIIEDLSTIRQSI